MVCINTCYSFKPFQWAKQTPRSWYPGITLINVLRHVDQKLPIFREQFLSHNPFFGQNWYEQPWTKSQPFSKQFSHKKWCFNLEGHWWHALLPGINRPWERKKNDCHIMHLKNLISLNKRKPSSKKMQKNINHFFSCKELLFSLGNYIWNEKWPSFTVPSLM